MKLSFVKASDFGQTTKCTIHKKGKLGFSETAIKKLNLISKRYVKIATNESERDDENLYIQIQENNDEFCFQANKAGKYFYINTKAFFDNLGLDYRKNSIIFDIVDFEYEGIKMFKLIRREKGRK